MTDDWNAKKEIQLLDYMEGSTLTCGYFLHETNLEILRKKLIRDYQNGALTVEQINKRFGVKG